MTGRRTSARAGCRTSARSDGRPRTSRQAEALTWITSSHACRCGNRLSVNEGAAGTQLPCSCGRTINVPTLRELRAATGDSALAPEFEVERLLLNGWIPEGERCVCCDSPAEIHRFWVQCDKAVVVQSEQRSILAYLLLWLITPLGALLAWGTRGRGNSVEHGRDIVYRLPLRVCDTCRNELKKEEAIMEALRSVPVYARLFEKYPAARANSPA